MHRRGAAVHAEQTEEARADYQNEDRDQRTAAPHRTAKASDRLFGRKCRAGTLLVGVAWPLRRDHRGRHGYAIPVASTRQAFFLCERLTRRAVLAAPRP